MGSGTITLRVMKPDPMPAADQRGRWSLPGRPTGTLVPTWGAGISSWFCFRVGVRGLVDCEGEGFVGQRGMRCLFLDEAGNFDFSERGTPYLLVCATYLQVEKGRSGDLAALRYELNAAGHDIESFHASANTPFVRQSFLRRLTAAGGELGIFAVVLDKTSFRETPPDPAETYLNLFSLVLGMANLWTGECAVYADRIPLQRSRKTIMKAVRQSLGPRAVHFHSAASSLELQIADYCTWAVWRQLVRQDVRPLEALGSPTVHLMVVGQGRPPRLS